MRAYTRRQVGFTMVELITVMVLLGVLAAIGIPRLMGDNNINAVVFGDQVTSAMRTAQKTAVAKRRLVCVTTTDRTVRLRIRTATGTGACNAQLTGVDTTQYDSSDTKVKMANTQTNLFFRPDGTIAASAAGAPLAGYAITIAQAGVVQRSIAIDGRTGLVN